MKLITNKIGPALAFGSLLIGSTPLFLGPSEEVANLDGFACEELNVGVAGTLTYEDSGFAHTSCQYDSANGAALVGWQSTGLAPWGGSTWYAFNEATTKSFANSVSAESFGDFYLINPQDRLFLLDAEGRVDTATEDWGFHFGSRTVFFGPRSAIAGMKATLGDRLAVLAGEVERLEDPVLNRETFEPNALDCLDVWDGTGLDPRYEVATRYRATPYLKCFIIQRGDNPFAFEVSPVQSFGFDFVGCNYVDSFREEAVSYDLESEESFGTFYGFENYVPIDIDGQDISTWGVFFDEDECVSYNGWPDIIAKMVAALNSDGDPSAPVVVDEPVGAGPDSAAVSASNVGFSAPGLLSMTSVYGAIAAVTLVGALLFLRRWVAVNARSAAFGSEDHPARSGSARRAPRVGFIVAVGLATVIGTTAINPPILAQLASGSFGVSSLVAHSIVWGIPIGVLTIVAGALVFLPSRREPLVNPGQALITGFLVVAAAIATAWSLVAVPVLPLLGVLLAVVPWRAGIHDVKRKTIALVGMSLLSLMLFISVSLKLVNQGAPEWLQQTLLVGLGISASSAAVLALPIQSFLGAGVWASHPLLWAGAVAVSWWLMIIAFDASPVATGVMTILAIAAVLVSQLIPFQKPRSSLPDRVSLTPPGVAIPVVARPDIASPVKSTAVSTMVGVDASGETSDDLVDVAAGELSLEDGGSVESVVKDAAVASSSSPGILDSENEVVEVLESEDSGGERVSELRSPAPDDLGRENLALASAKLSVVDGVVATVEMSDEVVDSTAGESSLEDEGRVDLVVKDGAVAPSDGLETTETHGVTEKADAGAGDALDSPDDDGGVSGAPSVWGEPGEQGVWGPVGDEAGFVPGGEVPGGWVEWEQPVGQFPPAGWDESAGQGVAFVPDGGVSGAPSVWGEPGEQGVWGPVGDEAGFVPGTAGEWQQLQDSPRGEPNEYPPVLETMAGDSQADYGESDEQLSAEPTVESTDK